MMIDLLLIAAPALFFLLCTLVFAAEAIWLAEPGEDIDLEPAERDRWHG